MIELDRVRLRPLAAGDAAALFAMYSDPGIARYLLHPPMTEAKQADEWLAKAMAADAAGTAMHWAIERRDGGAFIGDCQLFNLHAGSSRAELGYTIAREHWSQGYARETVAGLVRHAFTTLGLRRLEADVDPRNEPSLKILERQGFVREGVLRERWIVAGEPSSAAMYGLLRRDWTGG